MKDNDLREVVKLLSARINWLHDEMKIAKGTHIEGCKCRLCKPRANPFISTFGSSTMKKILEGEE